MVFAWPRQRCYFRPSRTVTVCTVTHIDAVISREKRAVQTQMHILQFIQLGRNVIAIYYRLKVKDNSVRV